MAFEKILSILLVLINLLSSNFYTYMPDKDINSPLFVVNKNYMISEEYVPELSIINAHGVAREFRLDMIEPVKLLLRSAKSQGVELHLVSGYRSYKKQNKVLESKLEKVKTEDAALEYVALPGSSEHQLGLAVDVSYDNWMGLNEAFERSKQGKWIRENAHNSGFILRYLPEYVDVTGYNYEPWHLRYVGIEHAKKIKETNEIPLEWYVSLLRFENYSKLLFKAEPDLKVWDYAVPLSDLFSLNMATEEELLINPLDNNSLMAVSENYSNILLRGESALSLKSLIDSAEVESYTIVPINAYDNSDKAGIYKTGMIVDLVGKNGEKGFKKSEDYKWLLANCADFGFILRYPEKKEKVCDHEGQAFTFRYVGKAPAKYIMENKLCFEEFLAEYKLKYEEYKSHNIPLSLAMYYTNNIVETADNAEKEIEITEEN